MRLTNLRKYFIWLLGVLLLLALLVSCDTTEQSSADTIATTVADTEEGTIADTQADTATATAAPVQTEAETVTVPEIPDGSFSTDDYTVSRVGDTYYLNFKNGNKASESDVTAGAMGDLTFNSLSHLIESLEKDLLEDWQKSVMRSAFRQDENGIVMFNKNQLYAPICPRGIAVSTVSWSGGESFGCYLSDGNSINIESAEGWQREKERIGIEFPQNLQDILVTETYEGTYEGIPCEWIEFSSAIGSTFKVAKFEVTLNGRYMYVVMNYQLSHAGPNEVSISDSVPYRVNAFCEEQGRYFEVIIRNPETAPTLEFLTSFGITPYVEPDAEITPVPAETQTVS